MTTVSFVAQPVLANNHDYGLTTTAGKAGLTIFGTADTLSAKVGAVLFGLISFVGVIFLVLTIYGGFLWMTAGGNTEKTKSAGAIIKNGVIGLIIVLGSYAIVTFVFSIILSGTGASTSSSSTPASIPDGTVAECGICIETPDCVVFTTPNTLFCYSITPDPTGTCRTSTGTC